MGYVEKSEGIIKVIMIMLLVVGVLLDLLAWKYRKCARFIIYYELIMNLLMSLTPINLGELSNAFYVLNICGSFCIFACQLDIEIFACAIVLTL